MKFDKVVVHSGTKEPAFEKNAVGRLDIWFRSRDEAFLSYESRPWVEWKTGTSIGECLKDWVNGD